MDEVTGGVEISAKDVLLMVGVSLAVVAVVLAVFPSLRNRTAARNTPPEN